MSLALALAVPALAAEAVEFDHTVWERVLKEHVNAIGEVDYAAIKENPADLDRYVALLAETSPENRPRTFPTRGHELAYWLNAYNALTIKGVVDGWPVKSVRDLGGLPAALFRQKRFVVGGKRVSLDYIEHEVIRPRYRDPRIHFALVCAAVSCPRLDRDAFRGNNLDEHLERLTRQFFAERRNLHINGGKNEVWLSKLLDWYGKDFEKDGRTVLGFVKSYAPEAARRRIETMKKPRLRFFSYDWSINSPGARGRATSPFERELAGATGR